MELTFGEQIKIILKRKNMTIRQLAELVEVQTGKPMSRQNLTQKLNRDNFQEQDMKEVAQALGCIVQISVIDPMEATVSSMQNIMVSQTTEAVQERRTAELKKGQRNGKGANEGHTSGRHSVGRLRAAHHLPHLQGMAHGEKAGTAKKAEPVKKAEQNAVKLAEEEAAVTRQPLPGIIAEEKDVNADILKEIEMALMESLQHELYPENTSGGDGEEQEKSEAGELEKGTESEKTKEPEVDTLAWARQKPLVWPTLTVPIGKTENVLPPVENEPLDAGQLKETPPETEVSSLPEAEISSLPDTEVSASLDTEVSALPDTEASSLPAEDEEAGELPFEEELFSDIDLEDIPVSFETADDPEDLEFFNLEDFSGAGVSQVSAPYVMKRQEVKKIQAAKKAQELKKPREKEKLFRKEKSSKKEGWFRKEGRPEEKTAEKIETAPETVWENRGLDLIPEGNGGDVSFASAPYTLQREPEPETEPEEAAVEEMNTGKQGQEEKLLILEENSEKLVQEDQNVKEESEETMSKSFRTLGDFSGSRGDISSVSAPYVIPRKPEELPLQKPMGEHGYWQDIDESEFEDWPALSKEEPDEEPEEEEEPLSPDIEEKIASWDAAVKRQLEHPFFRPQEGQRGRRGMREAEREAGNSGGKTGHAESEIRTEDGKRPEPEAGAEARANEKEKLDSSTRTEETKRWLKRTEEEEPLNLQGPAIDPGTGAEYETNTVKHHPTQPDMLLVYDKDEHRWIVQAERAFLNFQINKRALLGKDYEPPVYLD